MSPYYQNFNHLLANKLYNYDKLLWFKLSQTDPNYDVSAEIHESEAK